MYSGGRGSAQGSLGRSAGPGGVWSEAVGEDNKVQTQKKNNISVKFRGPNYKFVGKMNQ